MCQCSYDIPADHVSHVCTYAFAHLSDDVYSLLVSLDFTLQFLTVFPSVDCGVHNLERIKALEEEIRQGETTMKRK